MYAIRFHATIPQVVLCALCLAASPEARAAAPGTAAQPVTAEIVRPEGGEFRLGTTPVRFWGFALRDIPPLGEPLPDDAEPGADSESDAFLRRVRTAGANFLRLPMPSPTADDDAEELQRAIDRVLARSRAEGVHVWMGASRVLGDVSSNNVSILDDPASAEAWSASFAAFPGGTRWLDGALDRVWDPRLELLEISRLSGCVNHFNAFTGRTWANDPAIVLWELEGPDGWHSRMKAGEARSLPRPTVALLLSQFDRWLYDKYGDDKVPDPVPEEDRHAFLDVLWRAHKARVAEQFRLNGAGTRLAALALRENAYPDIRPDGSGCLVVYARPQDLPSIEIPDGDLAVLRVWMPPRDVYEPSAETPWEVLVAAKRFGAVAWDADLSGDAPRAFDAAFAVAGDVFRAGLDFPPDKLAVAPDGTSAKLRRKGFTWNRAARINALDVGGTGMVLAVPEAAPSDGGGEDDASRTDRTLPDSLAAAIFQPDTDSLTLHVAVEPAAEAVLAIGERAAEKGRLWQTLPVSYDIRNYSGEILATGTVETLPRTIPLPAKAFRIDIRR